VLLLHQRERLLTSNPFKFFLFLFLKVEKGVEKEIAASRPHPIQSIFGQQKTCCFRIIDVFRKILA